jgi:hypothetical protein
MMQQKKRKKTTNIAAIGVLYAKINGKFIPVNPVTFKPIMKKGVSHEDASIMDEVI